MAVDWIKSYTNLEDHPKTIRLRSLLRWNLNEVVGFLHRFWWRASRLCPDGDVTELCLPEVFAEAFDLKSGFGSKVVEAMVRVGFLDEVGEQKTIHDWSEYYWKQTIPTVRKQSQPSEIKEDAGNQQRNQDELSENCRKPSSPTNDQQSQPIDIESDTENQQKTDNVGSLDKIRRDKKRKETNKHVSLSGSEIEAASLRVVEAYSHQVKPRKIDNSGSKKRFVETTSKLLKSGVPESDLLAAIEHYAQSLPACPDGELKFRKGFQSFFGPRDDLWKDHVEPPAATDAIAYSSDDYEASPEDVALWIEFERSQQQKGASNG